MVEIVWLCDCVIVSTIYYLRTFKNTYNPINLVYHLDAPNLSKPASIYNSYTKDKYVLWKKILF